MKTWKREVALALLVGLGYVVWQDNVEMAKVIAWPVISFAAVAFGLDWYGKSGSVWRPTQSTDGRGS